MADTTFQQSLEFITAEHINALPSALPASGQSRNYLYLLLITCALVEGFW